jgi:hypothetical protein
MTLDDQLAVLGTVAIVTAVVTSKKDKAASDKIGYFGSGLLLLGGVACCIKAVIEIITIIWR